MGTVTVLRWLRTRDADLAALRRACRAAIVAPGLFAIGEEVIGNSTLAVFAAFGSLATLLFVDFTGPMRERLAAQVWLVLTGAVLVCVGTLVSQVVWLAAVTMFAVGFVVLFSGIVSSVLASASTALLAGLILPVSLAGPVGSLPDRLAGWLLAGATSVVAIGVLWPTPTRDPLRLATARACELLARRLRAEVDCVRGDFGADRREALAELTTEADEAVTELRRSFFGTPYRPTGLTTAARTLVRLVDQVVWLESILDRTPFDDRPGPSGAMVCEVKAKAADLLEHGALRLRCVDGGRCEDLGADLRRLHYARAAMEREVTSALPAPREAAVPDGDPRTATAGFVSSLEPSFRAQEMSFAISAIAENIELTVAAHRRTWWQQLLGRRPVGVSSPLASAQERAGAHVERHSVWLHNSVRGAIALGLAVLVAELTGVQHSFWVVFGTLAVLRSNALTTGQNALRGMAGTVVGIVIGGGLIFAVGSHSTVLWLLLPPAVLFTGLAPAAISFAAGQAGFTAALLILFNIIEPAGWTIGIVRIEDIAIGCAVSVVVGALFWPRGAGSALGLALSEALSDSARYVRGAIEYGVTRCDALVSTAPAPGEERRRAAAAARRLDDAFRGFLAERGTKHIPLADVTALVTTVAALRLTADTILDLWGRDDGSPTGDRTAARTEILRAGALLADRYEEMARALAGRGEMPAPATHDETTNGRLIDAVRHDLAGRDNRGTGTAIKMIWTADHIDAARRLQSAVVEPARAAARLRDELRAGTG